MALQEGFGLPKTDKTLATIQAGQKYGPSITLSNNNMILIDSNGLTESNYTASNYASGGEPWKACDGWSTYGNPLPDSTQPRAFTNYGLWYYGATTNQWWQVDLGEVKTNLSRVVLFNDPGYFLDRFAKDVIIKVSNDGTNWTDHTTFTTSTEIQENVIDFDPVDARYVRVHCTNNHGGTWTYLAEVRLYQMV